MGKPGAFATHPTSKVPTPPVLSQFPFLIGESGAAWSRDLWMAFEVIESMVYQGCHAGPGNSRWGWGIPG